MAEQNSYRWYILVASFLILVIDGGVRFSFGVLIKPLVGEFAWERGPSRLPTLSTCWSSLVVSRLLASFSTALNWPTPRHFDVSGNP